MPRNKSLTGVGYFPLLRRLKIGDILENFYIYAKNIIINICMFVLNFIQNVIYKTWQN